MSALIAGKPALLTTTDQWLLSAVLCLITIRLEFTDPQMQGVPADERRFLMERGHTPFDTWRIWIAKYDGENPEDHWSRHFGMQVVSSVDEISRPHKCNTQVTTMVTRPLRLPSAPKPADVADALALAVCHLWRAPTQARLAAAVSAVRAGDPTAGNAAASGAWGGRVRVGGASARPGGAWGGPIGRGRA